MNTQQLAEKIVNQFKFPKAEEYNLSYRHFDDMIEVIGLMNDPNCDYEECEKLNMDIPKCWITLGVIPASATVKDI